MDIMRLTKTGLAAFGLSCLLVLPAARAAAPTPLQQAVAQGKTLFTHATFGGNGTTCDTCHRDAGTANGVMPGGMTFPSLTSAAALFPRYQARTGHVVTLEDQINGCIRGPLRGKPIPYGGAKMRALVSYLTSLAEGKKIHMGGKLH